MGQGVTEWRWEIQATETGTQRLHLTLTAVIDVDGSRTPYTIETFERVLEIRVTWVDKLTGFGAGNWQWLWAAILVPIDGWALRSRRRAKVE